MKHHSAIGMYFLIAVSVVTLNVAAERVAASEPLPDASVLAYRSTPRQPKPPTPPKISEVTLTGVVNDVAPKGLTIKAGKTSASKDQTQWLVFAQSDSTEFTIRGTATLDYLRKGQTIEFGAQIAADEKVAKKADEEKVADKLDMLTIVSRKGGLAHLKNGDAKDHAVDPGAGRIEFRKKADSDPILATPDQSDPKAGNGGKAAAKPEAVAGGPKENIAGMIASWDKEKKSLTVTCGQRTIHVDLADIPTINVEIFLSDVKLVPDTKDKSKSRIEGNGVSGHLVPIITGDLDGAKIVVHGTGSESKQGNQCAAKSIEVTLAKPLTGNKKPASSEAKKTAAEE